MLGFDQLFHLHKTGTGRLLAIAQINAQQDNFLYYRNRDSLNVICILILFLLTGVRIGNPFVQKQLPFSVLFTKLNIFSSVLGRILDQLVSIIR